MRIETGKGTTIPLITLIAIWSVSAIISLPGLAISPILGDLKTIFPETSELEIQMLTSLPSLLIIPFVLLSGKLSVNENKLKILMIGLIVFLASGILYFFSSSMLYMICISCLLGAGAGMVIPLSTGLVASYFTGKYRVKQLGISSSIANLALVVVTFLTGYLAEWNWHYPFLVYLSPVFAICLSYYLKHDDPLPDKNTSRIKNVQPEKEIINTPNNGKIDYRRLSGVMLFYFVATYLVLIIPLNLSFILEEYKMNSSIAGTLIALFFLAVMLPGFFINKILHTFKCNTILYSLFSITAGLLLVLLTRFEWSIALGCFLSGLGYGVIQPVSYEKATQTSPSTEVTLALAFVMSVNYLAILLCPVIIDLFMSILHLHMQIVPFFINLVLVLLLIAITFFWRNSFVLGMGKEYYV
ncbi:MAG: MFS transporter [Bacteroidales bacterium]|nr:MFS transporter [Bacteroidales bacterium]